MAKLPGVNYRTTVQSLGRADPNLPMQVAASKIGVGEAALTSLAAFASAEIAKTYSIDTEDANNSYTVALSQSMDATSRLLSKQSYSPNEISGDIKYEKYRTVLNDDGTSSEQIRNVIPASEVNPQLFEQVYKNIASQATEHLSPEAREMFTKQFDKVYMKNRAVLVNDNRNKAIKDREVEVIKASMKLAQSGDFAGAANNVLQSNLSAGMKTQQIKKIETLSEDSRINGAMQDQDVQMMKFHVERLTSPDYDGPYSLQKRIRVTEGIEKSIDESYAEADEAIARKNAKEYSNLIIAANRGALTPAEIENAWDSQIIKTGTQRASLYAKIDRVYKERISETKALTDINQIMSTDMRFDPTNADHKKAVDTFFAENPSPEMAIELAKKGLLPKQVKGLFATFNRGGKPKMVAETANLYQNIMNVAPDAVRDLPAKHRDDMGNIAELIASGMPATEAVKLIEKWGTRSEGEQRILDAQYKTEILKGRAAHKQDEIERSTLQDLVDGDDLYDKTFLGLGGAPNVPTTMLSEYEILKRNNYRAFGDMEKASNRAYDTLKSNWGFTEVNGNKQIMKLAPEVLYKMPTKVIQSQLKTDLKSLGITSDARLTTNSQTAKDGFYQVTDANGMPIYGKNNMPQRWKPDRAKYVKAEEAKRQIELEKRKEEQAEELKEAKKKQVSADFHRKWADARSKVNYNKAAGFYSDKVRDIYKPKKETQAERDERGKGNFNKAAGFYSKKVRDIYK